MQGTTMAYEANMTILFDVITKSVLVSSRGELTTLPGPFPDRRTGIAAGEAYCKTLGWKTAPNHPDAAPLASQEANSGPGNL